MAGAKPERRVRVTARLAREMVEKAGSDVDIMLEKLVAAAGDTNRAAL